jgi:hypothetical protein
MDKTRDQVKRDWSWLPAFMPTVARLMAERRAKHGDAWVRECWRRGVTLGEPGHFWAAEGVLCVGVPAEATLVSDYYTLQAKYPQAAMLILPDPPSAEGGIDGSH